MIDLAAVERVNRYNRLCALEEAVLSLLDPDTLIASSIRRLREEAGEEPSPALPDSPPRTYSTAVADGVAVLLKGLPQHEWPSALSLISESIELCKTPWVFD